MSLYRTKTRWSGFPGAPGYTVLHFDAAVEPNGEGAANALNATWGFMDGIKSLLPTAVKLTVESTVEVISETDGELIDALSANPLTVISGTGNSTYSGVSGMCVSWTTPKVRNGRRVRGRTFIVPIHNGLYEGDGTVIPTALTTLGIAAQGLIDHTSDFAIFMRPSGPDATDGGQAIVTSYSVKDKAAVLRSRRD